MMLFTKIVLLGALLYDNLQSAVLDTSCFSAFSSSSELSVAQDTRSSPLLHAMACSSITIAASSLTTAGLIRRFYRPRYQQQRHWRPQTKAQVYSAYRASIPAVKPPTSKVYVLSLLRTTADSPADQRQQACPPKVRMDPRAATSDARTYTGTTC